MAGTALASMEIGQKPNLFHGMTLIELIIVVAIMAILLVLAFPSYRNYVLRVHRTEAIRMLLQASMCQERIYANGGSYNTNLCQPDTKHQRYKIAYQPSGPKGLGYVVEASPKDTQFADPCGSLSLDQNGARGISAKNVSVIKCWNGR